MDIKKTIGLNIKKYRKKAGYTQEELGKVFGITSVAVSKWETGTTAVDLETLQKIADLFNISVSLLLEGYIESNLINDIELTNDEREILGKLKSILNKLDI